MNDTQDLYYLEPQRSFPLWRWLLLLAACCLLLALIGASVAWGLGFFAPEPPPTPGPTLVPTFTPRPTETPVVPAITLSVRPWTDDSGPVGLVEVSLSVPETAQVAFTPPPGFRYWGGDLLQTVGGLAWNGSGRAHWYLLREPGAVFPATLEVKINGQRLAVPLQPATPATISATAKP